jgi:hypothetical protein
VDSHSNDRWQRGSDDSDALLHVQTVGWLIRDGKFQKTVCMTTTNQYVESAFQRQGQLSIPVGCIRKIIKIR